MLQTRGETYLWTFSSLQISLFEKTPRVEDGCEASDAPLFRSPTPTQLSSSITNDERSLESEAYKLAT